MPSVTVFMHPAVRMIKTIPPVDAPTRINGHLPRDTLGAGRVAPTDVVLADVQGQLAIQAITDRFNANIATIVLALDHGATSSFVLPFRSLQLNGARSTPGADTFNPSVPAIYPGLGAGTHGQDGGSFWFWEDAAEEGAQDRSRWAQIGAANRAIWTVWLLGAPGPVVQYAQHILETYPHHATTLPKWMRGTFPWRDAHIALPSTTPGKIVPPLPTKPSHLKGAPKVNSAPDMPAATAPDYRNSLVAVDNLTGQILGVLASDVALDAALAEDEESVMELAHSKAPTLTTNTAKDDDDAASTPRQSTFLRHPPSAAMSVASLTDGSHLADEHAAPSCRTSMASAAFFSAAGSEYGDNDDDELERRALNFELNDPLYAAEGSPASQLWRRAAPRSELQQRRETSQMSDRTSKAETAFEDLCETDDEGVAEDTVQSHARRHLPRSALRTSEIRSIEDTVWQQALENGDLPIDGAYTHLAAPRSRNTWSEETSAIELATHDSEPRRRPKGAAATANKGGHMQGGSVLIEFLAGSRIGASIIGRRSAGSSTAEVGGDAAKTSNGIKILGLVPILPAHFLSFFGLSTTSEGDQPSYLASLTIPTLASLFGEASDWVSNLFAPRGSTAAPRAPETAASDAEAEADESSVEQWEYAIPDFDPASLASTPRPVYRRKRPSSAIPRAESTTPYSVLHIDNTGVGRRAFFSPRTHR